MSERVGIALLALVVALAALSPILGAPVYGFVLGHDADFAINGVHMMGQAWSAGEGWPRWMMDTNYGLGGTTYYSYPPLSHWVATAVMKVAGVDAPAGVALSVALWRVLAVATTYLWLRRHVPAGPALCGAALAALLPYAALVNPWVRYAYAETAAAALLPLLLLALERAADGKRAEGLPALALAYAALAITNLPTCALAAHLGPIYAFGYAGRRGFLRAVLGGMGGALLAAAFLVPALGLLRHANAADLFNPLWRSHMLGYSIPDRFVLVIWASGLIMLGLGLALLKPAFGPRLRRRLGEPGLARALTLLLVCGFALSTVVALPLWWGMPQLTATEHPWRAYGHLVPVVGALAALAVARGLRPVWLLAAGLPLALAVPGFLLAKETLGYQAWPNFVPGEERLQLARQHYRAYSWEHVPAGAAAAGWDAIAWGAPEPHPRPPLPPGAERLRDGFRLPRLDGPVTLPQFYFPAWQARGALGPVPLRATPEGFLQLVPDQPTVDVVVRIMPTPAERIGWVVSALAALGLLLLELPLMRRRSGTATEGVSR